MAAEAVSYPAHDNLRDSTSSSQLGLYGAGRVGRTGAQPAATLPAATLPAAPLPGGTLCAGCRAKEARYGFRDDNREERPRTLCFECFRMELDFRQRVAAQLARGWNAQQAPLPLAVTLNELSLRRRRAQIKANRFVSS